VEGQGEQQALGQGEVSMIDTEQTKHDFRFTRNWFRRRNQATFEEYVLPMWAGKPITYLEIGVYEGQSLTWMMQNVLTHPDSRAVGIDPWLPLETECCLESESVAAALQLASIHFGDCVEEDAGD